LNLLRAAFAHEHYDGVSSPRQMRADDGAHRPGTQNCELSVCHASGPAAARD
jgi:hypothetical protein